MSRKKITHPKKTTNAPKQMPKMTNDALHERFVIGRHPVESALEMHRDANKLFIQEDSRGAVIERIIAYAKEANVPYTFVPKMKLDQMAAGQNHQGVLLMSSAVKYASLNDLFQVAQSRQEDPFFILLDGIEDPHNLGSILRTADAAGAHGVIILKHRAVGLTATVAKTAAGSLERVKVARVTNMVDTIEELKQRGLWIFGSDMDGVDYRQWQATGPIGVVIGNEGKGLSKRVSEHVDEKVCLPMIGGTESLNASVAASLLIYEVFRTRHPLT